MRTVSAAVFTAMVALAGGCGGDGGIAGSLDELEGINLDSEASLCACYQQLGYDTEEECLAYNYEPMTPAQRDCLIAALEQDADASQEFLDCVTPLIREQSSCLAAIDTCDDTFVDRALACSPDDGELEACQALLPASVDTAADACFE